MIGRQWVLPKPSNDDAYLRSCLHYLAETTGMKLRYRNREARGVCVWVTFNRGGDWQNKKMFRSSFFTNQDLWQIHHPLSRCSRGHQAHYSKNPFRWY